MTRLQSRCVSMLTPVILLPIVCHAQAVITNISYGPPGAFKGAPGQVVQLWVRGLNAPTAFADRLPLPTTLAGVSVGFTATGFSVDLRRTELGPGGAEILAPILSVLSSTTSGTFTSLVTIQIPTELSGCT